MGCGHGGSDSQVWGRKIQAVVGTMPPGFCCRHGWWLAGWPAGRLAGWLADWLRAPCLVKQQAVAEGTCPGTRNLGRHGTLKPPGLCGCFQVRGLAKGPGPEPSEACLFASGLCHLASVLCGKETHQRAEEPTSQGVFLGVWLLSWAQGLRKPQGQPQH